MSEKLHELKKSSSFTSTSGHNPSSFPDVSNGISLILNFAQLFRFRVAIIAALAGCATIYALFNKASLQQYLLATIVLFCMHSASMAINDYWDVDKDKIDHPERPLPSGCLSQKQAWWAAVVMFTCAISAAIPLGVYCLILVAVSTIILWNYSHILTYNGILGNFIVATIVAATILLASLVVNKPFAMLYPIGFLFCYTLAKEIIWDIHDAAGDRNQGIVTIANSWGKQTAFSIAWGLIGMLIASIPVAFLLLPMAHPLLFAVSLTLMLVSFAITLVRYQKLGSDNAYKGLVFWDNIGMLAGTVGLLGTAPA